MSIALLACALALAPSTAVEQAVRAFASEPALTGTRVSVCVTGEDGVVLAEYNPDLLLIPASNQKLLSGLFALEVLGPDYRPRTRFWRTERGAFVDAEGDPTLRREQLLAVRQTLGLEAGAVVQVRQPYRAGVPSHWEPRYFPDSYAPRIMAFTVDDGAFVFEGDLGVLEAPGPEVGVRVEYSGGTGPAVVRYDPLAALIRVSGWLPQERTVLGDFSLPEPDRTAAALVGGQLEPFTGPVPAATPVVTLEGPPMTDLLGLSLGLSDNHVAEHLFLAAAARQADLSADPWGTAAGALQRFLVESMGLRPEAVRALDGSGLSRQNRISARALSGLLVAAMKRDDFGVFAGELATGGSGTLSTRLPGSSFVGKTGTLNGVVCLSGYVVLPGGKLAAVSILVNDVTRPNAEVRAAQDRLIRRLEGTG